MEPVDLSMAKRADVGPTDVKDFYSRPTVRALFRPYETTDSGDAEAESGSERNDDEVKLESETDNLSENQLTPPASTPLKPTPCFAPTAAAAAGPNPWQNYFLSSVLPSGALDCAYDPYKAAAAANIAATYPFLAHQFGAHYFYVPPYQWYQKRISRPLCGKYVKSGPAASRMTLMALRQRILQRQQMKFFLHSMSAMAGREQSTG